MSGVSRELVTVTTAANGRARVLTARGDEVHGLRSLTIVCKPFQPAYAEMDVLIGAIDLECVPRVIAADPRTGQRKLLRRLEFEDGTCFDLDRMMPAKSVPAGEPGR